LGKRRDAVLSTGLALESLQNEVSFMAQHSANEGPEHLNNLEVKHLIKMTSDVVLKIKQQTWELTR
jgi:hypothetical protein